MSLAHLKERLSQISRKRSEDTFTFDITECKNLKQPEEWLEYIQHVRDNVGFPNDLTQHKVLSELYDKAFQEMSSSNHKSNETYAQLFVNYARLKSTYIPEDAIMLFNQARAIVRKFAMVHIASAQFELERDNPGKAKKILEKALLFETKPKEDIEIALKKLKEGAKEIYVSPPRRKHDDTEHLSRKGSSGSESSEELRPMSQLTDNISANLSANLSFSVPPARSHSQPKVELEPPLPLKVETSVKKGMTRYSRSTPLLNSEKRRNINIGLPARVKKINLPFEPMLDEEEEMNTMDCFKPLDNTKGVSFSSHAHTSGYLSMTADSTIPMDTKPPEVPKIEVVEQNMVEPPRDTLPKPVITPRLDVQETPNNKCLPPVSTPMPNMKMITINDVQYAVLGVMGKGGSSKVYQVFDNNHKIKAVKCVDLNNTNDSIVEGYKNEIKLLKRLQYCDQVIKMYDSEYKQDENQLYVLMECGNEDLASFFRSQTKTRRQLSDNLICFYWEMMLEAVQALHKEGIIHSDLKPANFLLVGGNLKLIDFGIAKALQQDKTSVILETPVGTLNYMSPEAIMDSCGDSQGEGKKKYKIGVKSDVWSLGCILYNMVYGRTPFQNLKHDLFKLQAIINPDFPIEFPDIPNKHLIDVMKRCLNRDPKARPSIDELLNHPYLKANKQGKEETTPPQSEKLIDKKMEAFISSLADQFALSPGGIRNLFHKTIVSDQKSPNAMPSQKSHQGNGGQMHHFNKPAKPVPEAQVKHLRTPLSSLNLIDTQSSGQDAVSRQRKASGT
ncbi:dual specificity protein kinase TTK-like isoform X2 [Ruditapes philippinarum]|uniref:dual specificity protein kinase TTK-like isoform X2 n=1 Tax=Ruditapes philippinarum TaxID=129788 RepID=UPI00295ADD07|nr:dual specificity protein kinase TTK-like isoform X2 [Ruditapes philippinarum]